MITRFLIIFLSAFLSFNANASFVRNINGTNYEWLELTQTIFMSRNQVEALLGDPGSSLYGYQYASRALTEDLYNSYITWDGLDGFHGNPDTVNGMHNMITDLGATEVFPSPDNWYTQDTVDGYTVTYGTRMHATFLYGLSEECGGTSSTCKGEFSVGYNYGVAAETVLSEANGLNANYEPVLLTSMDRIDYLGSLLVRPVPLPGAIWLFASGLIGIFGILKKNYRN